MLRIKSACLQACHIESLTSWKFTWTQLKIVSTISGSIVKSDTLAAVEF